VAHREASVGYGAFFAQIAVIAFVPLIARAEEKTVVPFVEGMTIKTGNSVANIDVRAKSFGPGACGVTFSTDGGNSIHFLALPLAYSPWTILASHAGATSFKITHTVECDTGILGEIRYYK
jgi:hypothetical protein